MLPFKTNLYYRLKPFLPWRLRMAGRRWHARRILKRCGDVWPIDPAAGRKPEGWPGWPDGKQFAFVLTHDVEGPAGLANVRALAELEMSLGFRSCFNFIPEGPYRVPPELRAWLVEKGFEVGVHDLHHDGRLYRNREYFRRCAQKINGYLAEWNAVGFRPGFMLRHLDWLHDLNILYDSSTFDTDPFEPQPDGVGTIFPFWVGRGDLRDHRPKTLDHRPESVDQGPESGDHRPKTIDQRAGGGEEGGERGGCAGYVELPYTLPQDSTLFLVLREKSPDIWLRKLDWVAQHGGMVLLNTHPDYVDFGSGKARSDTYPISYYRSFLENVRSRYSHTYWNAVPRQVARHVRDALPIPCRGHVGWPLDRHALQGKRAAVLLYSYYPSDPRPRRAAEALVEAGMELDLICLRENDSALKREVVNGVNVLRLPFRRRRESKLTYVRQYTVFFLACAAVLTARVRKKRYDLVHVHNMPDFLVFGALVPKLFGAKVILDLHDPMPELMQCIYNLPENHFLVRWLMRLEKQSIAFAHFVLTPNIAFRNLFVSRGCPPDKIDIVMNSPQSEIFDPAKYLAVERVAVNVRQPFRVMYHGLIAERHGLDTAIEALARVSSQIPFIELHIFGGRTPYMDLIEEMVERLGLQRCVCYHGYKPQEAIAQAIMSVNVGIIPNRRSSFTEINMPTRIFEYLAMGKPVIAPDTKGIRDYFQDGQLVFFEPGNAQDLARAILWTHEHPEAVCEMVRRGREVYGQHLWPTEKERFVGLVANLLNE